jgi:hypothetical protein
VRTMNIPPGFRRLCNHSAPAASFPALGRNQR